VRSNFTGIRAAFLSFAPKQPQQSRVVTMRRNEIENYILDATKQFLRPAIAGAVLNSNGGRDWAVTLSKGP